MKTVYSDHYSVSDIRKVNDLARADPVRLVQSCEEGYIQQLDQLAELLLQQPGQYAFVMLSGPSSSGKTTTALKLSQSLMRHGVPAQVISLDNFFLGADQYPRLPDGTADTESVHALDIPLLQECLQQLETEGRTLIPTFDFQRSARTAVSQPIVLGPGGMVVIEGLHALNPLLYQSIPNERVFRVYVGTRTKFMLDGREVLSPKDTRLIRRMVRDHKFRGHSPLSTLSMWEEVLEGEERYIDPYRDAVDFKIDSTHDYEGCVFHHYILPMVQALKAEPVYTGKVQEIVEALEIFWDIDKELIPSDSLLREFVG